MPSAVLFNKNDNVVVLTENTKAGDTVYVTDTDCSYTALEDIPVGHKMVTCQLKKDEYVVKFGIRIGRMMADVNSGSWISEHNLDDVTAELAEEYKTAFRERRRKISVYPRADGRFGIRNYVMVIPVSPESNLVAEAISDATGCCWMACARPHLVENRVSEYSRMAMGYTGCNPNVYAVLVLGTASEMETSDFVCNMLEGIGKPYRFISLDGDEAAARIEGEATVRKFMAEAEAQSRELRPIEGLTITVHCSGSDWTTTVAANPTVGQAADLLIHDGGRVLMSEWEGYCGNEHVMAAKCATYDMGLKLLDRVDSLRELVFKESGYPIEHMNPHPDNKKGGITTLVEKSHGTITKAGSTPIQGLLEYCEQPVGKGVYLELIDSLMPPTSGIYGSLHGAHIHILVTGLGYLYYEIPHMAGIRVTGNDDNFANPDYKLDFNASIAFREGLPKAGEKLYEYILDVAQGKCRTKSDENKQKVFHMWYYTENEFSENIDRSKMIYTRNNDYEINVKRYTDYVK
jgi:altronate dehydratase large subunit